MIHHPAEMKMTDVMTALNRTGLNSSILPDQLLSAIPQRWDNQTLPGVKSTSFSTFFKIVFKIVHQNRVPVSCCDPAVTQSWCHRFSARQLRIGATSPRSSLTSPPVRSTGKLHVSWKSFISLSATSQCMKRSNLNEKLRTNAHLYTGLYLMFYIGKIIAFTKGYFVPTTSFTTLPTDGPVHLAIWVDRSSKDIRSVKENRKRTASTCSLQDCNRKKDLVSCIFFFLIQSKHCSSY